MEPYFGVNYKLDRSENFNDLLVFLEARRKLPRRTLLVILLNATFLFKTIFLAVDKRITALWYYCTNVTDISFVQRKVAATLHPVQSVTDNGDGTYTIHYTCVVVSFTLTFTPGVEFEEIKPDGVKVQSLITFEGNTIKHRQREDNGRTLHHVYEFTPDTMTITTTAKGLDKVVKRYFKLKK